MTCPFLCALGMRYNLAVKVRYRLGSIPMPAKPLQGFVALAFGTLALRREHNRAVIDGLLKQCAFRQVFVDLNIRVPFDRSESIRFTLERAADAAAFFASSSREDR